MRLTRPCWYGISGQRYKWKRKRKTCLTQGRRSRTMPPPDLQIYFSLVWPWPLTSWPQKLIVSCPCPVDSGVKIGLFVCDKFGNIRRTANGPSGTHYASAYASLAWRRHNKNLAIANRSRVSCAHSASRASIVTPWPWNLGQGSLKVIETGTIRKLGCGLVSHSPSVVTIALSCIVCEI